MNSIRKKITVCLMATVLTALVLVGATSISLNYRSTIATVDQMMSETAVLAAERVEQELTAYKNVAMDTGCIAQLADPDTPVETKRAIIDERASMHGFQRGNVIGADGLSIFDGKDYSDREYVQQAMKGTVYVSEPLVSKITGELSIMVAAPPLCRRKPRLRDCGRGLLCAAGDLFERYRVLHQGEQKQPRLHDQ